MKTGNIQYLIQEAAEFGAAAETSRSTIRNLASQIDSFRKTIEQLPKSEARGALRVHCKNMGKNTLQLYESGEKIGSMQMQLLYDVAEDQN